MIQGPLFSYRIVGSDRRPRGAKIEVDNFEALLLNRGGIPFEALGSPIASWILARLTAEAGLGGSYAEFKQETDGGAFSLHLEVSDSDERILGGFELLGYTWGVELLGRCSHADPGDVVDDFLGLLLNQAESISRCRASVYDLEWKDQPYDYRPTPPSSESKNLYGWDGEFYLGNNNFWRESEQDRPWPGHDFRSYHQSILANYQAAELTEARKSKDSDLSGDDEWEDEATDDLVAAARSELESLCLQHHESSVTLRVYDLDGELTQNDHLSTQSALQRVGSWLGEGFDAAWRFVDGKVLVKVWEYPASEPPWDAVIHQQSYQPEIRP